MKITPLNDQKGRNSNSSLKRQHSSKILTTKQDFTGSICLDVFISVLPLLPLKDLLNLSISCKSLYLPIISMKSLTRANIGDSLDNPSTLKRRLKRIKRIFQKLTQLDAFINVGRDNKNNLLMPYKVITQLPIFTGVIYIPDESPDESPENVLDSISMIHGKKLISYLFLDLGWHVGDTWHDREKIDQDCSSCRKILKQKKFKIMIGNVLCLCEKSKIIVRDCHVGAESPRVKYLRNFIYSQLHNSIEHSKISSRKSPERLMSPMNAYQQSSQSPSSLIS